MSKCRLGTGKCVTVASEKAGVEEMEEEGRGSEGRQMEPATVQVVMLGRCRGSKSDSAPLRSLGSVLIVAAIEEHALLECTPEDDE